MSTSVPRIGGIQRVNSIVHDGWLEGLPAERIAHNAGIPRHHIGNRVMAIGLPARNHRMEIIEDSVITPMVRVSVDELIVERRLAEALLVET